MANFSYQDALAAYNAQQPTYRTVNNGNAMYEGQMLTGPLQEQITGQYQYGSDPRAVVYRDENGNLVLHSPTEGGSQERIFDSSGNVVYDKFNEDTSGRALRRNLMGIAGIASGPFLASAALGAGAGTTAGTAAGEAAGIGAYGSAEALPIGMNAATEGAVGSAAGLGETAGVGSLAGSAAGEAVGETAANGLTMEQAAQQAASADAFAAGAPAASAPAGATAGWLDQAAAATGLSKAALTKLIGAGLGGLLTTVVGQRNTTAGGGASQGFQGPIDQYSLTRQYNAPTSGTPGNRGGHKYFNDTWTKLAQGGVASLGYADGGRVDEVPGMTDADYANDPANARIAKRFPAGTLAGGPFTVKGLPYPYDLTIPGVKAQVVQHVNVAGLAGTNPNAGDVVFISRTEPDRHNTWQHETAHVLDKRGGMTPQAWLDQLESNAKALGLSGWGVRSKLNDKIQKNLPAIEGKNVSDDTRSEYKDLQHAFAYLSAADDTGVDVPKVLGLTPEETKLFRSMSGLRRTRLDARDLRPYVVDTANQKDESTIGLLRRKLGFAQGGVASLPPRMVQGAGDGMSDSIPAHIGGRKPAALADGEFVVPADVVSHLGNGSSEAGARRLYDMMDRIRQARTGSESQAPAVNAQKYLPV